MPLLFTQYKGLYVLMYKNQRKSSNMYCLTYFPLKIQRKTFSFPFVTHNSNNNIIIIVLPLAGIFCACAKKSFLHIFFPRLITSPLPCVRISPSLLPTFLSFCFPLALLLTFVSTFHPPLFNTSFIRFPNGTQMCCIFVVFVKPEANKFNEAKI